MGETIAEPDARDVTSCPPISPISRRTSVFVSRQYRLAGGGERPRPRRAPQTPPATRLARSRTAAPIGSAPARGTAQLFGTPCSFARCAHGVRRPRRRKESEPRLAAPCVGRAPGLVSVRIGRIAALAHIAASIRRRVFEARMVTARACRRRGRQDLTSGGQLVNLKYQRERLIFLWAGAIDERGATTGTN